jgi:hypothetical protein
MAGMIRLVLGAFLIAVAAPQESDDEFSRRVQALIDQFRESGTRKKAEAELIKIGPRALPLLRKEQTRAEGDFKTKLEGLIRTMNLADRRMRTQGKTMIVKVVAKDQPLADVASALQASTGVPIELQDAAIEAKVTLDAASSSLWEALDKLCKAHGRLTWDVSDKGIVVREGSNEPGLRAYASGYVLLIREFERRLSDGLMGKRDSINSRAYVAGPPGVLMFAGHVTFQVLVDDKGTNLMKSPGPSGSASISSFEILDDPDLARPLYSSLRDLQDPIPAKDATKVKVCRGVAFVRLAIDSRKGLEIRGPAIKTGAQASAPGLELKIEEMTLSDREIRMVIEVTDSNITVKKDRNALYPETGGRVILRDSRGVDIGAKLEQETGTTTMSGPVMSYDKQSTKFKVEGSLAYGVSLASIEVWEPSEIEEIKIPFDLKDIPIRKVK